MDMFKILKADHQKVIKLLEKIENGSKNIRSNSFPELVDEIKNHTKMEEKIFYPRLKEHPKTYELVLEAYEEHHLVDKIIADIKKIDFNDEVWKAKFSVLKENVEHHIKEEENSLFPLVDKTLSNQEKEEIADEFNYFKDKQMEKA